MTSVIITSKQDPTLNQTFSLKAEGDIEKIVISILATKLPHFEKLEIKQGKVFIDKKLLEGVDIRIVQTSTQNLPKTNRSLKEIQRDLFSSVDNPVVKVMAAVVFYPLSLLLRLFEGPRPDPSPLKQRENLDTVVKWTLQALEGTAADPKLIEQLKEFDQVKDAKTILDRFRTALKGESLVLLPLGFWENQDTFRSVLGAFYKNEEGKLALYQMNASSTDKPFEYVWDDVPEEKELNALLSHLKKLETKPAEVELPAPTRLLPPGPTQPEVIGRMDQFRRELLQSQKGKEVKNLKQKEQKDPWKMLQKTLRKLFPECSFAEKTLFTYTLLNDRVSKYIEGESRLTKEEKQFQLARLKKDLDRLERQLLKSSEGALGEQDLFKTLRETVKQLTLDIQRKEVKTSRLDSLKQAESTSYILELPQNQSLSAIETSLTAASSILSRLELGLVEDLKQAEIKNEPAKLLESLKAIETTLNKHVEDKNYEAAVELYKIIVRFLPSKKEYFDQLDETLIDKTSEAVGKINHLYWESKIRLKQFPLTTTEVTDIWISFHFVKQLLNERTKRIQIKGVSDFSEYYLLKAPDYSNLNELGDASYSGLEKFVRQEIDPPLVDKLQKLRAMESRVERRDFTVDKYPYTIGATWCQYKNIDPNTMDEGKFGEVNYLASSPGQLFSYPQVGMDLDRMKFILGTLLNPQSSFIPYKLNSHPPKEECASALQELDQKISQSKRLDFKAFNGTIENGGHLVDQDGKALCAIECGDKANRIHRDFKELDAHASAMGSPRSKFYDERCDVFHTNHEYEQEKQEANLLQTITGSDEGDPLRLWSLSRLKLRERFDSSFLKFTSPSSVEEVFNLIIHDFDILKGKEEKKRLFAILFEKGLAASHYQSHPEYFHEIKSLLKQKIDEAFEKKQVERAAFLLLLCDVVERENGSMRQKQLDSFERTNKNLSEEIKAPMRKERLSHYEGWPTTAQYLSRLSDELKKPGLSIEDRLTIANTFVNYFATHAHAYEPEKIPEFEDSMVALFIALNTLAVAKDSADIPQLSWANLNWAKQFLKPALLKSPSLSHAIDRWITIQEGKQVSPELYLTSAEDTYLLSKKGIKVDLNRFLLLEFDGKPVKGVTTQIPAEILNHPHLRTILNVKELKGVAYPSKNGRLIYEFTHQEVPYRLSTLEGGELIIERQSGGKYQRYQSLQSVPSTPLTGLEKVIQRNGIWRSLDYPLKAQVAGLKEKIDLTFDKKGKLIRADYIEGKIIKDAKGASLFSFLPDTSLLFLARQGASEITDIKILNNPFHLAKEGKKWVVQEGRYKSFEWGAGRELNPGLKEELANLSLPVEKFGLPLINPETGSTHLIAFTDENHFVDLEFKPDGTLSTSSEGFLYLASRYAEQGEYETAFHLIEKGRKTPTAAKDLSQLAKIQSIFKSLPSHSYRSTLIKIKAELALKRIIRLKNMEEDPRDHSFLADRKYLSDLHNKLDELKSRSPYTIREEWRSHVDKFGLNGEEIDEFKRLSNESLSQLLAAPQEIQAKSPHLSKPNGSVDNFLLHALSYHVPLKNPEEVFKSLKRPDEILLKHFFVFFNLISEKQFDVKDFPFLFEPITSSRAEEIEIARYLLLNYMRTRSSPFDLKEIARVKDTLPMSTLGMLMLGLKGEAFQQDLHKIKYKINTLIEGAPPHISLGDEAVISIKERADLLDISEFMRHTAKRSPQMAEFYRNEKNAHKLGDFIRAQNGELTLQEAAEFIFNEAKIDVIALEHEHQLEREILNLERKLGKPVPKTEWAEKQAQLFDDVDSIKYDLFKPVAAEKILSPQKVEEASLQLTGFSPTEVDSAKQKINEKALYQTEQVDPEKLDQIEKTLATHRDKLKVKTNELEDRILKNFASLPSNPKWPEKLRWMGLNPEKVPRKILLEQILEAYQINQISSLDSDIQKYLVFKIEEQQLGAPALDIINQLKVIKKQLPGSQKEWEISSFELKKLLETSLNRTRYNETEPRFARKYLVAELKNQIILSKSQTTLIPAIDKNPSDFYTLKTGDGKTSVILPIVLSLLAERRMPAVGIVTQAMASQSYESLDLATRLLREKAGVEFSLEIRNKVPSHVLAEKYYRLLKSVDDEDYILTTIQSKAAIDHLIVLLNEELKVCKEGKRLSEIQKELYWAKKIRSFTKSGQSIGDELDELVSISQEVNLALPKSIELDPTICNEMEKVMEKLFTAPSLDPLKTAIVQCKQTDFSDLPQMLENLVKELGMEKYRGFLLGKDEAPVLEQTKGEELQALKGILQTLPRSLKQKRGIDIDFKSDGFTVGPRDRTIEKEATFYGQEYDQIVNHYLIYGFRFPSSKFMEAAWDRFYEKNPRYANSILHRADSEELFSFLNRTENYKARLSILREMLIQKKEVRRFERQRVMNVQEQVMDEKFGGVSATVSPNELPRLKLTPPNRDVEAEVVLRMILSQSTKVTHVEDENQFEFLNSYVTDLECKAIINENFTLEGKNALEVVAKLREIDNSRIFIFIHPESRKEYMWAPNKDPRPISKKEIKDLNNDGAFRSKVLVYFGPADARGTDVKIPGGYAVQLTGENKARALQAAGRMRGLGEQHKVEFKVLNKAVGDFSTLRESWDKEELRSRTENHYKALELQFTSITRVGAQQIISVPSQKQDNPDYWESKAREKDIEFDVKIFDIVSKVLILSRKTDLTPQATKDKTFEDSIRLEIKKQREIITKFKEEFHKIIPDFRELDRVNEVSKIIQEMEKNLKTKEEWFNSNLEELKHIFQKTNPQAIQNGAGTLEQVQEQAEEIALELTQTQEQSKKEKMIPQFAKVVFEPQSFFDYKKQSKFSIFPFPSLRPEKQKESLSKFGMIFSKNLSISNYMYEMLKIYPLSDEVPLRVFIREDNVYLISTSDYLYGYGRRASEESEPMAVFSLLKGSIKLDRTFEDFATPKLTPEVTKTLVQLKWILGYSTYSEEEMAILKNWIKDSWNFICQDPEVKSSPHEKILLGQEVIRAYARSPQQKAILAEFQEDKPKTRDS